MLWRTCPWARSNGWPSTRRRWCRTSLSGWCGRWRRPLGCRWPTCGSRTAPTSSRWSYRPDQNEVTHNILVFFNLLHIQGRYLLDFEGWEKMCLLHAVTNFKRCTLSQKVISILRDITQNVAGKRDTTRNISCTVESRFPLYIVLYRRNY